MYIETFSSSHPEWPIVPDDKPNKLISIANKIYSVGHTIIDQAQNVLNTLRSLTNAVKTLLPSTMVQKELIFFRCIQGLKLINVLWLPFTVIAIFSSMIGTGKAIFTPEGGKHDFLEIPKQFSGIVGNMGDFLLTGAAAVESVAEVCVFANVEGAAAVAASIGAVTIWVTVAGSGLLLGLIGLQSFAAH